MSPARSVAVIGAGMAGTAAAQRLSAAGLDVLIVDKGRGVGGRMATRRLGETFSVDHGAQYFTAHDPLFAAQVEAWIGAGVAAAWNAGPGWFVGTPAMTAPARALSDGLPVQMGVTVARLARDGGVWHLIDERGDAIGEGRAFDALLVTAPAPQAWALLATAAVDLPALARVRYAPCWALMLVHDGPSPGTEPAHRDPDPDAALAWVARNDRKPGRASEPGTVVAHASPSWSRTHLERDPAEAADLLRAELSKVTGFATGPVRSMTAHRWRYALVEEAIGEPCLWQPQMGLGYASDGCLGGRVEAAYLSGVALAERVLADG